MALDPSTLSFFKKAKEDEVKNPPKPLEKKSIEELRAISDFVMNFTGKPASYHYKEDFIIARDGYQIPFRIYNDDVDNKKPILIFFPGTAYINPLFEANAIACSRIAKHLKSKVVIVNYRLAPEYPLPTAIYDGYDAVKYISKNYNHFNIDSEKIFIGGISSGAGMAAIISNLSRNDKDINIFHQILLNGLYDLTQSSHDYDTFANEDYLCSREYVNIITKFYGIKNQDLKNSLFSPYFEKDLSNLPPTTFIIAEYEGLRNDSEAYYKKVKEANTQVKKIILPGQVHDTMLMREVLPDGEDPAKVIVNVVLNNI